MIDVSPGIPYSKDEATSHRASPSWPPTGSCAGYLSELRSVVSALLDHPQDERLNLLAFDLVCPSKDLPPDLVRTLAALVSGGRPPGCPPPVRPEGADKIGMALVLSGSEIKSDLQMAMYEGGGRGVRFGLASKTQDAPLLRHVLRGGGKFESKAHVSGALSNPSLPHEDRYAAILRAGQALGPDPRVDPDHGPDFFRWAAAKAVASAPEAFFQADASFGGPDPWTYGDRLACAVAEPELKRSASMRVEASEDAVAEAVAEGAADRYAPPARGAPGILLDAMDLHPSGSKVSAALARTHAFDRTAHERVDAGIRREEKIAAFSKAFGFEPDAGAEGRGGGTRAAAAEGTETGRGLEP